MNRLDPHFCRLFLRSVLLTLGLVLCGCYPSTFMSTPSTNTPLQDDSYLLSGRLSSEDSVTLEVFLVRCPYGDTELNSTLWPDVDEQVFPTSLRREMSANGFRAGLIGNQLPVSFLRILKTRDDEDPSQIVTTVRLDDLSDSQRLTRKTICSRNGQRNEVNVSEIKPQATILFNENGALGGETFTVAQGVMVIKTQTCGDGSVTLEFLPEVQYGQPRQTFAYDAGAVTMATARPKRSFDTLRSSLNVRPGQFVVLTCLPEMSGNVGSFFFTEENADAGEEQKLLCVRVLQTQHNELYAQDGLLPMDPAHTEDSEATEDANTSEE